MYKEMIPRKLKEARKQAGYTQSQIADILKIPQNTISRYETGEREADYETLAKLIDFYEVSADWILGTGIKTTTQQPPWAAR